MLRDRLTQIRADILTNVIQPGRFATIGNNPTFHIAGRRPNGLLLGILIDDRRDPREHNTYLAEEGEVLKSDFGTFLALKGGSIQRLESGARDPRFITFQNYAFDLSQLTPGLQNAKYGAREKPIWELLSDLTPEPLERAQYRVEFHDRLASCLYPLAFVIVAYMFLGTPQTTRQSRTLAFVAMISAVALLRLVGFLSTILGVNMPALLALQYVALLGSLGASLLQISRGHALEPAASVSRLATAISARFS